ncbi:L,D-transpeptidase [Bathymodiolus japonicus methanotrophic gill symbiont]|uniref:L,D-transpeptidase family protein n=1 Tax=Bathymodiolus japonicus methanotrophic gill symbiont TaxID=113269 RepID=UPI001C8EE006
MSNTLPNRYIVVCIAKQTLDIIDNKKVVNSYRVSTAKNGAGERMGSECTPRGWHKIRARIGKEQPLNSVFVGRRATGEIYSAELSQKYPDRDWILTRILWLGGLEAGFNRYGLVDSAWRYIYIHGCPDHLMQGKPESHGCIRIRNADVLDLFNKVKAGDLVLIHLKFPNY